MSAAKTRTTRSYMPRARRREALLGVAAEIIENEGWTALSMVSLARQAEVSRQLVYQHFDSVDALQLAALAHIFEDVFVRTRDEVLRGQAGDFMATVQAMQRITFDIPTGRARALWQVITAAGAGAPGSQISNLSRRLRHLLIKTVQPLLERHLGLSEAQARPLTWMLIVAFWGARQLTDEEELSREQAMQLFDWLIARVAFGSRNGVPPAFGDPTESKPKRATAAKKTGKTSRSPARPRRARKP